jgi:NADH dehydrogenase
MNHSGQKKHHVVIVGMGFAGLYTYQTLVEKAKREDGIAVTLVGDSDSFIFTPLIHEVATGLLRPDSVVQPLRGTIGPLVHEFLEGRVTRVDLEKKTVMVNLTEGVSKEYPYDTLVMAAGSTTNYMNVPGAEEHSLPLKTLEDAKNIKNKLLAEFDDAADRIRAGGKASVDIVVVGGGATGVEVAGELSDFLELLSTTYCDVKVPHGITLLDGGPELVKGAHPWMSRKAKQILTSRPNVTVLLNMRVNEVSKDGVKTPETMLPSTMTIWTAGVKAVEIEWRPEGRVLPDERSRRLPVTHTLSMQSFPDVYVLGDQALACAETCPYPMRAQIAAKQGEATGANILRKLRGQEQQTFAWRDKGFILSLGEGGGVAELLGKLHFSGFIAWAIYRIAYLNALVGGRAKLRTALEWLINLFKARDMGKV